MEMWIYSNKINDNVIDNDPWNPPLNLSRGQGGIRYFSWTARYIPAAMMKG